MAGCSYTLLEEALVSGAQHWFSAELSTVQQAHAAACDAATTAGLSGIRMSKPESSSQLHSDRPDQCHDCGRGPPASARYLGPTLSLHPGCMNLRAHRCGGRVFSQN